MMTQQALNKRRALIIRRQSAQRMRRVQRETQLKRRAAQGDDPDEVVNEAIGEDDLLAELPEGLLG